VSPNGDHREGKLDTRPVVDAARSSNKLFQLLVVHLSKLFQDQSVPREIKLFLAPLLFMVPVYSLLLVIFLGDIAYCSIRNRDVQVFHYLIFLGTTLPVTFAMLLAYAVVAGKYEALKNLESQLQSVTKTRSSRRRSVGRAI